MNHDHLLNSFKINPLGDLRSSKTFKIDDFMRHFNPIMLFLQICHETSCHIFCAPVLLCFHYGHQTKKVLTQWWDLPPILWNIKPPSMQDHCASGESQWGLLLFKRDSDFRPALVPNIAQLSLEHLLLLEWYLHKRVRGMGVSLSPEFSGNAVLNPFSTAAVPVDPVEKEGGDPIENLLPALLQIFLTVRLDLHNIGPPVKRW